MDFDIVDKRMVADREQELPGNGLAPASDLLEVENLSLHFRGVKALTEVAFSVRSGELFSVIGPNGAGKTSLLNCISGRYSPTRRPRAVRRA